MNCPGGFVAFFGQLHGVTGCVGGITAPDRVCGKLSVKGPITYYQKTQYMDFVRNLVVSQRSAQR
jgi:hypothetical protein